jgi:hypothetical protein
MPRATKNTDEMHALVSRWNVRWYVGHYNCIRSVFCTGHAKDHSSKMCIACELVSRDKRVLRRAKDKASVLGSYTTCKPTWEAMKGMKNTDLVHSQAQLKLELSAEGAEKARTKRRNVTGRMHTMGAKLDAVKLELKALSQKEKDIPQFLTVLRDAHVSGVLGEKRALVEVLQAVSDALKSGRRHRKLSPVMKAFYSKLLVHGGQVVHNFVSKIFEGPHIRTTRRFTKGPITEFMLGLKADFFRSVYHMLSHWGIQDAPVIIGEDATALQPRLDTVVEAGHLYVMGYVGGKLEVKSKEDLLLINKTQNLATSYYLLVVIPLVPGAPYIPLGVQLHDGTKNTFNSASITNTWHEILGIAQKEGLHVVGHVGDGAPQYRKAVYGLMLRNTPLNASALHVDHPFIQLLVPMVIKDNPMTLVSSTVDYLHI